MSFALSYNLSSDILSGGFDNFEHNYFPLHSLSIPDCVWIKIVKLNLNGYCKFFLSKKKFDSYTFSC